MTINISRESVTEPLVEQEPYTARFIAAAVALWHSDIVWKMWMVVRFAACVVAVWYGATFAAHTARNDLDAVAMALMAGAVITVAFGRREGGE